MFKKYLSVLLMLSMSAVFVGQGSQEADSDEELQYSEQELAFANALTFSPPDVCEAWRLLDHDPALVAVRYPPGMTPLHIAAERGNMGLVVLLLWRGAEVDAQNAWGWTPLHFAAERNLLQALGVLLQAGANIDIVGDGDTALHAAARNCRSKSALCLLQNGAFSDLQNRSRQTPLQIVVDKTRFVGGKACIQVFLEWGDAVDDAIAKKLDRVFPEWRQIQLDAGVLKFALLGKIQNEVGVLLPRDLKMIVLSFVCQTNVCQKVMQ